MDNQERELILGLANRLRQAHPAPKDPQAAELIAQYIASQPDSLYLLVQTVLVQEESLRTLQARAAQAPNPAFSQNTGHGQPQTTGGFLSRQGHDGYPAEQPRQGNGFLKTAGVAAAGVAGGALLFAGLNEVFSDEPEHQAEGGGGDSGWDLF
ncbi:DUF2076 family protein [Lentzea sp. NPDC005914]|uniref:DUF2076 domain-containing protein n=1 Tax=Lentzea sp. NPDC005914 TaxID=3154572 RepID=UPI0034090A11